MQPLTFAGNVGINLFQRRSAGPAGDADDAFASTVASLPAGADGARGAAGTPPADPHSLPPDSGLLDSQPAPPEFEAQLPAAQRPTTARIGRYALKGPLGSGGLGEVHEAWDPLLSRVVAVKTLQFQTDPRERVALDGLFLNEARAVASLNHPHIVTIHDAGLSAHGVYIAMERLHGRDLRHALAAGWQPTPAQSALLVRRVAEALAYAHARGVIHCDIKPANIFLCRRDKPKVLDFGIARVAHGRPQSHLQGAVMGSPHYLAPEQLEGREVDARTDIHALGVVFYELLAGRRAFTGDSIEQISTAILTHHPAPAHELRPEVPRALSLIAAKAMARNPAKRYPNALAMARELRSWLAAHEAEAAAPAPARPRARDAAVPARRRWLWAGGALAGAAVLAVALGASRRAGAPEAVAAVPGVPPPVPAPLPDASPADPRATAPAAAGEARPQPAATAAPTPARATTGNRAAPPPARANPAAVAPAAAPTPEAPAPAPAPGTLQLAISPWGEVEIDGRVVGVAPPLTRLQLSPGAHQVVVRNADFPPFQATVQVESDATTVLRHRFKP
ncbi:MAG: serine/threonine-protein kinase [Betaproteobacteria bacterium]|nr:serine/threonine protein kinase [Rubrivivax sp.]